LALSLAACTPGAGEAAGTGSEEELTLPSRLRHWFASPPDPAEATPSEGWFARACALPLEQLRRIRRGYHPRRSHDVIFVPREPNFVGTFDYTTHGGPWDYLQKVPLVFYGPGFIRSQGSVSLGREATLADIAPTVAELLDVPWPKNRPGRPITQALVPDDRRPGSPRVIVTIVWDGGGWDVLETWPESWPRLAGLVRKGTSIEGAVVGSAPSVTPPVHATIGTGAFPKQHGIVDLNQRDGERVTDSYGSKGGDFTPKYLRLQTLADIYDRRVANRAQIGLLGYRGWHLGMMSHGAYLEEADKDEAVVIDRLDGSLVTSPSFYSLPGYMHNVPGLEADIRRADLDDGKVDGKWMGHVSLEDPVVQQYTPAWTLYQTRLAKALLGGGDFGTDRVPDMFFVNYKQIDDVGHFYNMLGPEMREIVGYTDAALSDLIGFLDERVGRRRWVLVLTADHGETPDARAVGAWPIGTGVLENAIGEHFGVDPARLFLAKRTMGFWLSGKVRAEHGITLSEVAAFIADYRLEDSLGPDQEVPEEYRDRLNEPLFSTAFPGKRMAQIWACAKGR
jgi:Type I phosphodiesterase / nucleotide pyrophosphatase